MNSNYYAVIMAGGVGSRFWPVSTRSFPKQFHDMLGSGKSLLQQTFDRLTRFVPKENVLILTNELYDGLVKEQLPAIDDGQILLEPAMRNTAPCILYAALKINKKNPDAQIIVAPSDHLIEDENAFEEDVLRAYQFCESKEALVTLGIRPDHPNTGYGYIEFDTSDSNAIKAVSQFREKPDLETARKFLDSGNFLWNAGIFIWSVNSVLDAFKNHQNEMYSLFAQGIPVYNTELEDDFIRENYPKAENISVDYAIMEPSDNVYVLPAGFDWNDLGTWGSVYNKLEKDASDNAVVNSRVNLTNSSGNLIRTESNKIVVVDGLEDYIIVEEGEVLLIVPQSKEQDIKAIRANIQAEYGEKYG